jgi:hypothetical protein
MPHRDIRPNTVLRPASDKAPDANPKWPVLILHAQRGDQVAVLDIRRDPRQPHWAPAARLQRWVDEGVLVPEPFTQPDSALYVGHEGIHNYNERVVAFSPLANSPDADLLDYPDEFARVCTDHAKRHGYHPRWIKKLACLWLMNGRTLSALMNNYRNCGAPGKKRGFSNTVPGPKQSDGPEYAVLEAVPYSREERKWLLDQAKAILDAKNE